MSNIPVIDGNSDKSYWHGFIDFYEPFFKKKKFSYIAEFGIFRGDSIRWLLSRFQDAEIYGADILPLQSDWPISDRFHFTNLDQNNIDQIKSFLDLKTFDLIIEDGSHNPQHQVNCLIIGLDKLSSEGIYILEDIHTSLPNHPLFIIESTEACKRYGGPGNALTVLLGISHYQQIGIEINLEVAKKIALKSMMTPDEVLKLAKIIHKIHIYRRSKLPIKCFRCSSIDFNFSDLLCSCGEKIFSEYDSMTAVIEKK